MKSSGIHVIGIGQPAAGDDSIGIAIVREIAGQPWSENLQIHEVTDPLRLIDMMDPECRMILVDAVVGNGKYGTVTRLDPEDLEGGSVQPVSSHGSNVAQAITLARTLALTPAMPEISIVAVTIHPPSYYSYQLSPDVVAAVPDAVALVQKLVEK